MARPAVLWRSRGLQGRNALIALIALQSACAIYFLAGIAIPLFGLRLEPIAWRLHEILEIAIAVGLVIGVGLGAVTLNSMYRRASEAEERLRIASEAFVDVLDARFAEWRLTPAERDVALFALKGLSTQEIAALRSTTEGTVKAQSNAIYRKAGVSGRTQLLSLFIDELMDARPASHASA